MVGSWLIDLYSVIGWVYQYLISTWLFIFLTKEYESVYITLSTDFLSSIKAGVPDNLDILATVIGGLYFFFLTLTLLYMLYYIYLTKYLLTLPPIGGYREEPPGVPIH